MKIAINKCFGVFGLSEKAYEFLGIPWDRYGHAFKGNRTDPKLIHCIETLGSEAASGKYAELAVVEIPDDVQYEIEDYDGIELIHETHRIWS